MVLLTEILSEEANRNDLSGIEWSRDNTIRTIAPTQNWMHPRTCDLFAIAGVLVYHVVGRLLAAPTCGTPDNYRLQITTKRSSFAGEMYFFDDMCRRIGRWSFCLGLT